MHKDESNTLKAIESKLTNLVSCILKKAESDPDFADQIEKILLDDSPQIKPSSNKTRTKKQKIFSTVAYLHEHGDTKLQEELDKKTDDELKSIMRSEGIKITKGKRAKSIERQEIIEKIVLHSQQRLNQGSVFLSIRNTQEKE
jgi:hypothetical protein